MKKIFIGIDVSKETVDVSVIIPTQTDCKPVLVDYHQYENRPGGFRSMVAQVRRVAQGIPVGDWLFCCETTGAYDRALCDYLYGRGLDIWRESALRIRWSRGIARGKSDKADSFTIAEYAWRQQDKVQLYVSPDEKVQQLKALYLYRQKLVDEKKAKEVRAKEIKATVADSVAVRFMYKDSMKEIKRINESIAECETLMQQLIESDEEMNRNYGHITSIKSVGKVTAWGLIIYSNNFKTITTSRKASCYCGCAAFYEDSGTSVHKKVNTKSLCNKQLKVVLTMSARNAIINNPDIKAYAKRMDAMGKCYGIIVNNVRNKLLHIIYSLVKNDCDYEDHHEWKRNQTA